MERRLRLVLLGLLSLIALLCVPLAASAADQRSAALEAERRDQLTYLASLVPPAGHGSGRDRASTAAEPVWLRAAVLRYYETYDEPVLVVDDSGRTIVSAGRLGPDRVRQAVAARLIDAPPAPFPTALPWRRSPVVLGVTARSGDEVIGAVITEVRPSDAAGDVLRAWGLIALGGVVMVLVAGGIARQLSAWLVRPLRRLEESVADLAEGRAREVEATGPPELQALVASYNTMATAVTRSLTDQARLVADAAHQLRNPLMAVRLRADLLDGLDEAELERGRQALVGEIERLELLLDQMLLLARTEARNARGADSAPTGDVGAVIEERLSAWRPSADEQDQELTFATPSAVVSLAIRQDDLEQLLDVLVGNAVQHAGGGARIEVSTGPARRPGFVEVVVGDNGPGIPDDALPQATQRFWQAVDGEGGSGLGLAIAAELAAGAAGELRLARSESGGLAATVTLPGRCDA